MAESRSEASGISLEGSGSTRRRGKSHWRTSEGRTLGEIDTGRRGKRRTRDRERIRSSSDEWLSGTEGGRRSASGGSGSGGGLLLLLLLSGSVWFGHEDGPLMLSIDYVIIIVSSEGIGRIHSSIGRDSVVSSIDLLEDHPPHSIDGSDVNRELPILFRRLSNSPRDNFFGLIGGGNGRIEGVL